MRLLERHRHYALRTERTVVRPARASVIAQAMVEGGGRWTFPQVLSAIDQHEQGDFSMSGLLVDAMGRDDRIEGCRSTRRNAIIGKNGLHFSIEPVKGSSTRGYAKQVEAWWWQVVPDAVLKQLADDVVMMGFHLSRVHWLRSDRQWIPNQLERWHPTHVRFDNETNQYVARTEDGEIHIDPDDPEWLLITPFGSRSWMGGGVRALGGAYVMRQFNWRDWSRFNEKHGMPLIAIEEPSGASDKTRKDFFGSVQKMGSTGIVRLPYSNAGAGFKISYVEAKDRGYGTFEDFRKNLDISIAVCLLGQNLTTEVQGGSFAAATALDLVRHDYLVADTEILSTGLRAQLVMRWGRFNVPGWSDEDAPWPTWDTSIPVDKKAEADTINVIADGVTKLQKTGMPVDFAELFDRVGLPMRKGTDPNKVEAPKPEPVALPNDDAPTQQRHRATESLRAGMLAPKRSGFTNGQLYADDLVDEGRKRAGGTARAEDGATSADHFIDEILTIIDQGADYESIRAAVMRHYEDAEPEHVRSVLEKVLVLAQLAGRQAVHEDGEADDA